MWNFQRGLVPSLSNWRRVSLLRGCLFLHVVAGSGYFRGWVHPTSPVLLVRCELTLREHLVSPRNQLAGRKGKINLRRVSSHALFPCDMFSWVTFPPEWLG